METILLVEDAGGVRSLVRELLEKRGYTVLEAGGPEEALELAAAHGGTIDLLLTDLVLPRMSGHDLARRLRERACFKVIYMSGNPIDLLQTGVPDTHFLEKPFRPQTLLAMINKALRTS